MDLFQLHGCGTALVTPFHTDGSLDEQAMRRLHRRLGPLMQVLFIESNPIPVKAALAVGGEFVASRCDGRLILPSAAPLPAIRSEIERRSAFVEHRFRQSSLQPRTCAMADHLPYLQWTSSIAFREFLLLVQRIAGAGG